jgi:hypothetical protein
LGSNHRILKSASTVSSPIETLVTPCRPLRTGRTDAKRHVGSHTHSPLPARTRCFPRVLPAISRVIVAYKRHLRLTDIIATAVAKNVSSPSYHVLSRAASTPVSTCAFTYQHPQLGWRGEGPGARRIRAVESDNACGDRKRFCCGLATPVGGETTAADGAASAGGEAAAARGSERVAPGGA